MPYSNKKFEAEYQKKTVSSQVHDKWKNETKKIVTKKSKA